MMQCRKILNRPVPNGMLVMWCERAVKSALLYLQTITILKSFLRNYISNQK